MRKLQTIFWAVSVIFSAIAIALLFMPDESYMSIWFYLIFIAVNVLYLFIRSSSNSKLKEIDNIYVNKCDPHGYIEAIEKDQKNIFKTKMYNYFYQGTIANVYIDEGDFTKARAILEELSNHENEMNDAVLNLYYKGWFHYFLEYGKFDKCQILLEQMQSLTQDAKKVKMKMFIQTNYLICMFKYNALTQRDIENTEKFFKDMCKSKITKLHTIKSMYYLAIIALNKGEVDKAKERFEYVKKHGNKLYIVKKIEKAYS